jgi:hypothetical protein
MARYLDMKLNLDLKKGSLVYGHDMMCRYGAYALMKTEFFSIQP